MQNYKLNQFKQNSLTRQEFEIGIRKVLENPNYISVSAIIDFFSSTLIVNNNCTLIRIPKV